MVALPAAVAAGRRQIITMHAMTDCSQGRILFERSSEVGYRRFHLSVDKCIYTVYSGAVFCICSLVVVFEFLVHDKLRIGHAN